MIIQSAFVNDAEAVQSIYVFHVLNGTASFDTEPPDSEFWRGRIAHVQGKKWPFLVAREGGNVLGYAYASQFRNRPAYEHTCEDSIYIASDARGKGLGTRLLGKLIEEAKAAGFEQMIAVIGGGEPASVALHTKLGFGHAGRMRDVGFKFGRKLDTVYMQKSLLA